MVQIVIYRVDDDVLLNETECDRATAENFNETSDGKWCPRVWDGLVCWPPTPSNSQATFQCDIFWNIANQSVASKLCEKSGVWSSVGIEASENSRNSTLAGWTNYTQCISDNNQPISQEWIQILKEISTVGYSVSLITLIVSVFILLSFRKLKCPRNHLHLHLFVSFILRASFILLKNWTSIGKYSQYSLNASQSLHEVSTDFNNTDLSATFWWCKMLSAMWQYFIIANYSWIFMEGLYLHTIIFRALFTDNSSIKFYIICGWGAPAIFVGTWSVLRYFFDDFQCWTINNETWIFWTCIRLPVALSNLVNFCFFLNVIRVLLLKLKSNVNSYASPQYMKLCKSTLVLVPLFGVHYFLLWGFSASSNSKIELTWLILDQVFSSFQGFFVSVLYCLMNSEVIQELKKMYVRRFSNERHMSYSHIFHSITKPSTKRTSLQSEVNHISMEMQQPNDKSNVGNCSIDENNKFKEFLLKMHSRKSWGELVGSKAPVTCLSKAEKQNIMNELANELDEVKPIMNDCKNCVQEESNTIQTICNPENLK